MLELDLLVVDKPTDIQLPELSPEEVKIIGMVRSTWQEFKDWFSSNHKTRIRSNYRRYNATVEDYEDIDDQWRGINGHPIRLALEYTTVETYKTRLLKAILGNLTDLVKILPTKTATVKNAELMNKVLLHFIDKDDLVGKIITLIDQVCLNGSVPWLVSQKQNKRHFTKKVIKEEPVFTGAVQTGVNQVEEEVSAWEYIENRPSLEIYDIETVGFNPTMGEYKNSPYFVFRQLTHRSILSKIYPELESIFNSGLLDWGGSDDYSAERQAEVGKSQNLTQSKRGRIEVFYWLEPEGMVVVFSDKIMLRYKNETASHIKEVYTGMLNLLPKSFEPYGLDLITLTSQFADLWNEIINIDVDSTKLATSIMAKVKKDTGTDYSSIFGAPGNLWLMENLEDVEQLSLNYTPGSALRLLEYISTKDQQATGATNVTQGVPSDAKFAADIQRMVIESNLKFWLAHVHVKVELKEIFRAFVRHIQEYIAPTLSAENPLVFMITGEKGFDQQQIDNPADLEGDFDYRISLDIDDLDQNLLRAQLAQSIKIISETPIFAQSIGNPGELVKLLFKMFPNIKDIEKIFGSPEEQLKKTLDMLSSDQLVQVLAYLQQTIPVKQQEEQTAVALPGGVPRMPTQGAQIARNPVPGLPQVAGGNVPMRMF